MTEDAHIALVESLAEAMQRQLSSDAAARLAAYVRQVVTWNRRVGLIGARGAEERVEILIADALVLTSTRLVPEGARLLDVGSGAGAPVLPLLLLREDLSAVLVESRRKRVAFLRTTTETLEIGGRVRVSEQRLDPSKPAVAGAPFAVAMSRATFPPEVWVSAGAALARHTLLFTAREQPPAPPAGSEQTGSVDYRLPGSGAPRRVTVYSRLRDGM